MNAERYMSRKFLLALLVLGISVGSRWMNWIDGAQLVNLVASTMLFYSAANVAQNINTSKSEG